MSPLYCRANIVCRCFEISEAELLTAIDRGELHTLADVIRQTGAGDGCTACRQRILEYLRESHTMAATS